MISLSDTAALYFYSAVFQGNMAILALAGVFVVYRLQVNSNQIQNVENAIVNFAQNSLDALPEVKHIPLVYDKVTGIPKYLKEIADGQHEAYVFWLREAIGRLADDERLTRMIGARERIVDFRRSVKLRMKTPFLLTLGVAMLSLIMMPIASSLHETSPALELGLILLTAGLDIAALWATKKLVWFALKLKES